MGVALFTFTTANEVNPVNVLADSVAAQGTDLRAVFTAARSALASAAAWMRAVGVVFGEMADPSTLGLDEATLIERFERLMALKPEMDRMAALAAELGAHWDDGGIPATPVETLAAETAELEKSVAAVEAGLTAIGEPFSSQLQSLYVKRYVEQIANE